MTPRLSVLAAKVIAVLMLIALAAGILAVRSCRRAATGAAEVRLEKRQASAAVASGHDAIETLGAAQANETVIHEQVREGQDAISEAPAGDSNDVADRAACRMRSYRHTARCVALLGAAAE